MGGHEVLEGGEELRCRAVGQALGRERETLCRGEEWMTCHLPYRGRSGNCGSELSGHRGQLSLAEQWEVSDRRLISLILGA